MKFRRICRLNPTAALLQPTETVSTEGWKFRHSAPESHLPVTRWIQTL